MSDESKIVYITVGNPRSPFPMATKVSAIVWFPDGETPVKIAKKMRKSFADHPSMHGYSLDTKPFKPSFLYYAIYEEKSGVVPTWSSDNFPGQDFIHENSIMTSSTSW